MNRNVTNRVKRVPPWMIGVALSLFISTAFVLISPSFLLNGTVQIDHIKYILLAIQGLSVFIGTWVARKTMENNKLIGSILVAIIYLMCTITISIVFFDGVSASIWSSFMSCMAGMITAVLITTKMQEGVKRKRRRGV